MKKTFYSTVLMFLFAVGISAQERYVDPVFTGIDVLPAQIYGTNISIIRGLANAFPQSLEMDVYMPAGDTVSSRPCVLIAHTGSFLPIYLNQTTTGTRLDSTTIEVMKRLVTRGYVVGVYDYRQGWDPANDDEDARKGTLLQAAYRGIQDTRTAIRYMRKSVEEDGNPYGIDPDKLGVWGVGTGGYLALGAATLSGIDEVTLNKFRATDGSPLIVEQISGDIDGKLEAYFDFPDNTAPSNLPNHVDYSSDFAFSFNMGGALGDSTWIDGDDFEPVMSGVHTTQDAFAPYYNGLVVVPTTRAEVVEVAGTRLAVQKANEAGNNEVIDGLGSSDDVLSELIDEQINTVGLVQATREQLVIGLGTEHFYGFDIPITFDSLGNAQVQGSPWDWWSLEDFIAVAMSFGGTEDDAIAIHNANLQGNPDMSAEKARTYIDSVFMLAVPRMYLTFDLGDAITATDDLVDGSAVGLNAYPNPAQNQMSFETKDVMIENISVFNQQGLMIQRLKDVNTTKYEWQRPSEFKDGIYIFQLHTTEGTVARKVMLQ